MAEWFGIADEDAQTRLLDAWADAPVDQAELCEMILETAREQVIAYAPTPDPDELVVIDGVLQSGSVTPARYVYAQLQQAVNLWNAGRVATDGNVGDGGFTFTPRPLDKTIRSIIRPVDGKPHVL